MTSHPTHTTLVMPAADASNIHADLVSAVAPMGDRHFRPDPTHEVGGVEYTRVSWVVRPSVATALADLAETYDNLSINPRPTPYATPAYPPLPDTGEQVDARAIYEHDGRLVQARQSHIRTEHAPGDVLALFLTYRDGADGLDWIAAEQVDVGDVREYGGTEYRCIQTHATQEGWEPPNVPALWTALVPIPPGGSSGPAQWTAGEAVSVGDVRTHDGAEYRCLQTHTTQVGWEPPNVPALWTAA